MTTQKAKNGITIPSILNNKESADMLTVMDENPVAVINHIKDLIQEIKLKGLEIKELEKQNKHLVNVFEELIDYAIELREKMGYDIDAESFKYEWFEKSNII
jgi:hypothetical protein